jgi:hypothetical protein
MLVFLGETRDRRIVKTLKASGWGRLWADRKKVETYPDEPWAFDNGAFVAWKRGESFPVRKFNERLDAALSAAPTPRMAVAPDIVAGGATSLRFSLDWLPKLPAEWPWFLAVQDGMTPADVAPELHHFRGIFLGGSDRFKNEEAKQWCVLAHLAGIPFHYGRAGTLRKVRHAKRIGADSIDSAFPLWCIARLERFVDQVKTGGPQLELRFI